MPTRDNSMTDRGEDYEQLLARNAELADTIRPLTSDNERLRAERPAPEWVALKVAAADCGVTYETARGWCAAGSVQARRIGGRWLVSQISMAARARVFHRIAF